MGAGKPPTVTDAPPSVVTSLPSGPNADTATTEPSFKPLPKIAAIEPGATVDGATAKLALLTTPPSRMSGPPGAGGRYLYKNESAARVSVSGIVFRSV